MDTKTILVGLSGVIVGGLIVSVAASQQHSGNSGMSTKQMTSQLQNKTGDDYDMAFISNMISHHQGAVAMAKLSATNAKHQEVKDLSTAIISAQEKEIDLMQSWQQDWGYKQVPSMGHSDMDIN